MQWPYFPLSVIALVELTKTSQGNQRSSNTFCSRNVLPTTSSFRRVIANWCMLQTGRMTFLCLKFRRSVVTRAHQLAWLVRGTLLAHRRVDSPAEWLTHYKTNLSRHNLLIINHYDEDFHYHLRGCFIVVRHGPGLQTIWCEALLYNDLFYCAFLLAILWRTRLVYWFYILRKHLTFFN